MQIMHQSHVLLATNHSFIHSLNFSVNFSFISSDHTQPSSKFPYSVSTASSGMRPLFLVSEWNLLELWLWPLLFHYFQHTLGWYMTFWKVGCAVTFTWEFHPGSRSATGTGRLPTNISVCLLLTGKFKAEA